MLNELFLSENLWDALIVLVLLIALLCLILGIKLFISIFKKRK